MKRWIRSCLKCQRGKIQRHAHNVTEKIPTPDQRFHQVQLDIIGLLPEIGGYRYYLTMIDRFSRWPEAIPLPNMHAQTITAAFMDNWVARYGIPRVITSDQERQYEGSLFKALIQFLGAAKTRTTPYHSTSNGLIERWYCTLKATHMCHKDNRQWLDALPVVMLGLRTAYKTSSVHPQSYCLACH